MLTSQSALIYLSIFKALQSLARKQDKTKTVVLTFPELIWLENLWMHIWELFKTLRTSVLRKEIQKCWLRQWTSCHFGSYFSLRFSGKYLFICSFCEKDYSRYCSQPSQTLRKRSQIVLWGACVIMVVEWY